MGFGLPETAGASPIRAAAAAAAATNPLRPERIRVSRSMTRKNPDIAVREAKAHGTHSLYLNESRCFLGIETVDSGTTHNQKDSVC